MEYNKCCIEDIYAYERLKNTLIFSIRGMMLSNAIYFLNNVVNKSVFYARKLFYSLWGILKVSVHSESPKIFLRDLKMYY